ncbi:MAG TPA: hypothetical protein VEQ59_17635, partial [Polyangiaceae bacterium]|nr:hypothetical protein [Polyangiaceae bacterium]
MAAAFRRTLTFLEAEERAPLGGWVSVVVAVMAVVGAWLVLARTTVYCVSQEGRLLASGAASPLQTPVPGVIRETRLVLGAQVKAGDELVVLDASTEG